MGKLDERLVQEWIKRFVASERQHKSSEFSVFTVYNTKATIEIC